MTRKVETEVRLMSEAAEVFTCDLPSSCLCDLGLPSAAFTDADTGNSGVCLFGMCRVPDRVWIISRIQ